MATLIGDGGHAQDIKATLPWYWRQIPTHHAWDGDAPVIIGINDVQMRHSVAMEMEIFDIAWVHPDAKLYVDVTYDFGTHINYGAMMTRTTLGHHCTIAPGVHMAGDITIGDRVFIGIGAIIGNLVTIGDDAIVGAGSVVLKDVPANTKVLGVWA